MWFKDKKKETPEKDGAKRLIQVAKKHGWKCHRLNISAGNYSTPGFPDYYFTHVKYGARWVEFKVPSGRLESSQVEKFKEFAEHGIGVWILYDEKDYDKLLKESNWWQYTWRGLIR